MNVIVFNAKIRVQGQQVINSPLYMTVGPAELTTPQHGYTSKALIDDHPRIHGNDHS